jgi:drug/metabolite transporter (DMT)-like permease
MFGNQFFYMMGVYYVGADIAAVFQPVTAVWTTVLAIVTRIEKPPSLKSFYGWAKILGIIFGVGGAITMLTDTLTHPEDSSSSFTSIKSHRSSFKSIIGIVFLFTDTICISIYLLIQKRYIFDQRDLRWSQYPVSVTAWSYLFSVICMAIASFYYVGKCPHVGACKGNDPWHVGVEASIPMVYAIFISSALGYMLLSWGNMHMSPSVIAAFWPVQIPVTIVLSYFMLGERLTFLDYIGGALIIAGLSLVVYSNWVSEKSQRRYLASLVIQNSEERSQTFHSSEPLLRSSPDEEDSTVAAGNIQ